jgi:hypothetical protein
VPQQLFADWVQPPPFSLVPVTRGSDATAPISNAIRDLAFQAAFLGSGQEDWLSEDELIALVQKPIRGRGALDADLLSDEMSEPDAAESALAKP